MIEIFYDICQEILLIFYCLRHISYAIFVLSYFDPSTNVNKATAEDWSIYIDSIQNMSHKKANKSSWITYQNSVSLTYMFYWFCWLYKSWFHSLVMVSILLLYGFAPTVMSSSRAFGVSVSVCCLYTLCILHLYFPIGFQ